MVALRPFVGHVVAAEHAAEVVAPPYDLLDPGQRAEITANRPDSFLGVLPSGEDRGAGDADLRANREVLERLIDTGRFVAVPGPALGVLHLEHPGGDTVAVIGDVDVEAFVDGRVLPHERVRPGRVERLARHLEVVRVASSPVCAVHRPSASVTALTDRILRDSTPAVRFLTSDDVRLTLHLVTDPDECDRLAAAVDGAGRLYIADGHHRAAAVAHRGGDAAVVLTAAVPSDQLDVLAFHRRVDGLEDPSAPRVMAQLEVAGLRPEPLARAAAPIAPGVVHITVEGRWWVLDLRERRAPDPVEGLDVRLVERELLEPLGGLGADPDHPRGVEVVAIPAPSGLEALVRPGSVGIALHPPSIEDMLAVSDAGAVMPAKSTYLAPKLRSGLIVVPREVHGRGARS